MSQTGLLLNVQQVTLTDAIESFVRLALSGKADQTKLWYRARLKLLAQFLGEKRPLSNILEIDLIQLREHWEASRLAPDTLHGYLRATRRLFRWLFKRGIISMDITTELHLPRIPRRGRKGISDVHALAILREAQSHSKRDYAMLLFFASTSARRGGVASLRLSDLNLDADPPANRQARVIEKGQKERTVIMCAKTLAALRAWLAVRPSGSEFVFVSNQGKPLHANSISEIIDRYKKRLGIVGQCSPHQWRHRWFRILISDRMPLTQAAQLGGHESVKVTYDFYSQFAMDELQEAYDKHRVTP